MTADIEVREYRDGDIESFHVLHDAVFPPVPLEEMRRWMSREDVTAGVAIRAGEVVGEIPLHVREFAIRPGVVARFAFEHSVCVHEDMRGQGIGSAIQDEIKRFMPGRAEVLSVYRGGERTPAYNHYDKNGLKDLCYIRNWSLEDPSAVAEPVGEAQALEAVLERAEALIAVFESSFGHAGGYQVRRPGFYAGAMTQLEAVELGTDYRVLLVGDEERPEGHCILGVPPGEGAVAIMELATRTGDPVVARRLLRGACQVAAAEDRPVRAELHDRGLYRPVFEALGFEPGARGDMIMATPLDWTGLAEIVWAPQPELQGVRVELWTPQEEAVMHDPPSASRTLTVEMKHHQAARWLLSRLDLRAGVEGETVTLLGARPGDAGALARAIPFTAWEYQAIDHI
ncbi:MAG: GNAT family N-acetyltransferase [Armatimonadota bacterium]|nr:GNAT family N-acetyltransferase [Armatimonadota bacterium]